MTGSSVQIGGVLFGGVADLAGGPPEERKKGRGKSQKGSNKTEGVKDARAGLLGRIFGSSSRQKGKVEDRSNGATSRVSEAPAEFLPLPCPPEPSELDSPVISPRPEASGEEESRSLRERLRAAETHKGPGPAGPIHSFESYVIESLTRKQRRPALDLAALAAASENGTGVERAESDTWQGAPGREAGGADSRSGEGLEPANGSYQADSRTGEGSESPSIRPGKSVGTVSSVRTRGGASLKLAEEPVGPGKRVEQGACSGTGSVRESASREPRLDAAASQREDEQGLEGSHGGEGLEAESRSPDERAFGRLKEFDYERQVWVERGDSGTDRRPDAWPASGVLKEDGGTPNGESRPVSGKAAGSSYTEEFGREIVSDSRSSTLPDLRGTEGEERRNGKSNRVGVNGDTASGGIDWWPLKHGRNGQSDGESGGVELLQQKDSKRGGMIGVQKSGEEGKTFANIHPRKSISGTSRA